MSKTEPLFQLQTFDAEIDQTAAEIARIEQQLAGAGPAAVWGQRVKQADARLTAARQSLRDTETALTDLTVKLKRESGKLFDGKTVSSKELTALEREVDHLKARKGELEDTIIEQMEAVEKVEQLLAAITAQYEKQREIDRGASAELRDKRDTLATRLATLQQKRAAQAATIDSSLLKDYERLRQTRKGVAVVRLDGTVCGGCRLSPSSAELQRIRGTSDEIFHCSTCGRILHVH